MAATIDTLMVSVHLLFAGIWAGTTVFVSVGVVPAARSGGLGADARSTVAGRSAIVSRTSALLLLITGGHLAGTRYTVGSLFGSTDGYLVLAMVALWLALGGLTEVGKSKFGDGQIGAAGRLYGIASAVAVGLLLVGGVLAA